MSEMNCENYLEVPLLKSWKKFIVNNPVILLTRRCNQLLHCSSLVLALLVVLRVFGFYHKQETKCQIGAYYFDGWTGTYPYHITKSLVDSFSDRESKWGWITSKQATMNAQIDEASGAGLSFFCFCWYFNRNKTTEPLNNALRLYLNAPNKAKLKFCIMVTNHKGFEIKKQDWAGLTTEWTTLFAAPTYVTVAGKPLLLFFDLKGLVEKFGGADSVSSAFRQLRTEAQKMGLKGVNIAACVGNNKAQIELAESCGFDLLTGYNYHSAGFEETQVTPIETLTENERNVWTSIANQSSLKYIPVTTLNWDPRPWASTSSSYATSHFYQGFSSSSVQKSVASICDWISGHTTQTTEEKLGMLYAWNEYGEGAWLTPSKNQKDNLLDGVKRALQK